MAKAPTTGPTVGIVSLGCPKALVDSERIITRLRSEGYQLSGSYEGADLVVVNTCGFLDSAKAESLDAIGEALLQGRNVELRNFGVFEVQVRKARVGRNPNKPEKDVVIPRRAVVKFKAGKELKAGLKKLDLDKTESL